jgi:hypothetical protein
MKHVRVSKTLMYVFMVSGLMVVIPQLRAQTLQQSTMLEEMLTAREKQIQITPLTHTFGNFSMEAAYYIQNSLWSAPQKLVQFL